MTIISLIALTGCEIENDNRIGYGYSLDKQVSADCINSVLSEMNGVMNLVNADGAFKYVQLDYQISLKIVKVGNLVSRYDLDIDGQHLDQDNGVFYRNAHKLATNLKTVLLAQCE